jgi:hypothetical protein
MLFGEMVAVYCENHRECTITLFGKSAEFLMRKLVVHSSYLQGQPAARIRQAALA